MVAPLAAHPQCSADKRLIFGSALTTWGFFGGLVGLAAFFSGFVSILAWPGVALLSLSSVRPLEHTTVRRKLSAIAENLGLLQPVSGSGLAGVVAAVTLLPAYVEAVEAYLLRS